MAQDTDMSINFHSWWSAPKTWAEVQAIDTSGSHANWLESFPWTRLPNVAHPSEPNAPPDRDLMRVSSPEEARRVLGDGSVGGDYQKPDQAMLKVWEAGVLKTRELLERPWLKTR
jgi:creatinine amidohydrolase